MTSASGRDFGRTGDEDIGETGRRGAESVFRYVERSAEVVPDGVRWRTLTWENEPQYDFSVFYGSGGIPIFLADYGRLTGDGRALELAEGGMRWCSQPARLHEGSAEEWRNDGLVRGRAGIGYGWLRLAGVTGSNDHLARAVEMGDLLLKKDPGPVTDWLDGAAGEGIFLLRLAQATRAARFRDGAVRWAEWLAAAAIRDAHGTYWPWQVDDPKHGDWFGLSFVPGMSGIAHYLLLAHEETGERRWADVAREAAETLRRQAVPDRGGLNWPDTLDGFTKGEVRKCQWCYGASGAGIFFVKAHQVLGAGGAVDYLAIAESAGETTYAYGDARHNAIQCHGMAGNAELFLDLYLATGQRRWRERAYDFARRAFAYREETPDGDRWQADDPGFYGPEYLLGASGTGQFFLRLWKPEQIIRPLV
jgi:lantibiotic modifying enzyme